MPNAERLSKRSHSDASTSARAIEAFAVADYQSVIHEDSTRNAPEVELLKVQALMRLGCNAEAYERLEVRSQAYWREQRPFADALAGIALIRVGRLNEGRRRIIDAESGLDERAPSDVRAETTYYVAQAAWALRDLEKATGLLKSIARDSGLPYVRALDLRGYIASAQDDLASASRYHSLALSEYKRSSIIDVHLFCNLVAQVLLFGVELLDPFLVSQAEEDAASIAWSEAVSRPRYLIDFYAGKLALLRGDSSAAYDRFEACTQIRDSSSQRGIAFLELSALEALVDEPFAASKWRERAMSVLRGIVWSDADADQRMALLLTCDAASTIGDVSSGSGALVRYLSASPPKGKPTAFSSDSRTRAFEWKARGHVASLQGDQDAAVKWFERAYSEFRRLRMEYRCVLVALELRRLGGERYSADLVRLREAYPAALVARSFEAALALEKGVENAANDRDDPVTLVSSARLGKAEARVYDLICKGMSTIAIAAELGKSVHTINNQTRRIFRTFGVRSRSALILQNIESAARRNAS